MEVFPDSASSNNIFLFLFLLLHDLFFPAREVYRLW